MTDRDQDLPELPDDVQPEKPKELPELPDDVEVELAELPEDTVELPELPGDAVEVPKAVPATKPAPRPVQTKPAPVPAAKPAPKPVAKPAPKPVAKPAPKPVAKPAPAPVAKPEAAPASDASAESAAEPAASPKPAVVAKGGGSRRERMERDKEERKTKKKKGASWERWPGPGEKPSREMERAPTILRKAALVLLVGSFFPWGGVTPDWLGNLGEKLLVFVGLWVWHQSHLLRDNAKVSGFIGKLGAKSFLPLFVLAGLLALAGFLPIFSFASLTGEGASGNFGPFAEKGFMILAGLTVTHIYDYQHGGKFNPMFPIMFLAPGIAGIMALLKVFSADPIGIGQILGGLGAISVGGAGWMSAYTMYVAMKEAKAHGEAKRAAQAEARKAARAARKA